MISIVLVMRLLKRKVVRSMKSMNRIRGIMMVTKKAIEVKKRTKNKQKPKW